MTLIDPTMRTKLHEKKMPGRESGGKPDGNVEKPKEEKTTKATFLSQNGGQNGEGKRKKGQLK